MPVSPIHYPAVLHHNREVRFSRREARSIWKGFRRNVDSKEDRERANRSEQSTQTCSQDYRWVAQPLGSFSLLTSFANTAECGEM